MIIDAALLVNLCSERLLLQNSGPKDDAPPPRDKNPISSVLLPITDGTDALRTLPVLLSLYSKLLSKESSSPKEARRLASSRKVLQSVEKILSSQMFRNCTKFKVVHRILTQNQLNETPLPVSKASKQEKRRKKAKDHEKQNPLDANSKARNFFSPSKQQLS